MWNDSRRAQALMRERNRLERSLEGYEEIQRELADNQELVELAEAEDDEALVEEAFAALRKLQLRSGVIELETLLSGEADGNDAFLEIHAGAGGTEGQDWAEMTARLTHLEMEISQREETDARHTTMMEALRGRKHRLV